MTALTKMGH